MPFYPRNGAVKEAGIMPNRKALEQARVADHDLAQVSSVYSDFRLVASKAVRKRRLVRTNSTEVEPPTKVVNNVGANEQQPAAAAGLDSNGKGLGASPAGAADHLVKAMLFIGVYGNNGPKAVLIHLPVDKKLGIQ